jgi:hypothetical protein
MKVFYLKSQHGSVTIIAVFFVVFFSIILSGLMPMTINQVSLILKSRDTVEAQYAAESGVKRAIVAFNSTAQDWEWLNSDRPFIDDAKSKKYKVTIYQSSDLTTPVTPNVTSNSKYVIKSIGTVGKSSKTVYADVGVTAGNDIKKTLFQYVGYAGGAVSFEQLPAVNGAPFGVVGSFSNASGRNVINVGNYTMPSYDILTALRDPSKTVVIVSGSYEIPMNTDTKDTTLIVNGSLTGTNIKFTNSNIFVTGSTNLSNINMSGSFLVSQGSLSTTDNSNFGNSVVVTYGALASKNTNITGAIIAAGSMAFYGGANFTYDESIVKKFIAGIGGTPIIAIDNWKSN